MALKEWLIDADVFYTNNAFTEFNFEDLVNQQKRITMRQNFHYFIDVEHNQFPLAKIISNNKGGIRSSAVSK
jgi:hypothetical protein